MRAGNPHVIKRFFPGLSVVACVLGWTLAMPPVHAADAAAGSDVFKAECAECHSPRAGRNKKGPSLFGIVGRRAATLPDYAYSDALRGHGDWVWTPERLRSYLSQPARQTNPGTKMKYDGLTDAAELDDLIVYLGTVH
jgi:cytochrome c